MTKKAKQVDADFFANSRKEPTPINGVKGTTLLTFLPKFKFIRGTTINYMHCVYLGVKCLLDFGLIQNIELHLGL